MTSALFMAVGCIVYRLGQVNLDDLKGVFFKMPVTMASFVLTLAALIGVPPTCGFFSKWYLIGGAFQAGVGLLLVLSLARSGLDLVLANSVKVVVTLVVSVFALPVFIFNHQVYWKEAVVLAAGLTIGAVVGARFAVLGGVSLIRKVLIVAVVVFSGRLLNLY